MHLQQSVRAYSTFALSVFPAEQAAVAWLTRSAMYSLGPGCLLALATMGARFRRPDVGVTAQATRMRAATSHHEVLQEVDAGVARAGDDDEALLAQRHGAWRACNVLSAFRRARGDLGRMPEAVRKEATNQRRMVQDLAELAFPAHLRRWLARPCAEH